MQHKTNLMKTKVLFNSWSIIITLLFVCLLIDASAQTTDSKQIIKFRNIPSQSDTLNIGNKDILLENSPMLFFPDYNKLFNDRTEVTILVTGLGKEKGYSVNFIVKDSILYLKRVTPKGTDIEAFSTEKKDPTRVYKIKVSKEEIKARVEKMTNRKFDRKGLLKADWISGVFYGGVDGEFIGKVYGSNYSTNTYFKVVFEKGVLKESTMFKGKSVAQYHRGE